MSDAQRVHIGPVRVAVIAVSPQRRAHLQVLVDASPALGFAGSAADADMLADCLAGAVPDVVVVDVDSDANEDGKTAFDLGHIQPALVVLIDAEDSDWILDALPAEATAILPHDATPGEIVAAIEAVAAGLCVLSPDILARFLTRRKPPHQPASGEPLEALSSREIEVLAMLADGLGNKEIARQLDISDNTVKFHVSSIFGKLGATNRTEAVMLGMRHGYIMV
jgi:DNA-binding NarL/FixJ family response regulator